MQVLSLADHVIAVSIDSKLTGADLEHIEQITQEKLKRSNELSFYIEIERFEGYSADAFLKDIQYGFSHLKHMNKVALVTSHKWLNKISDLESSLLSNARFKHFDTEQIEAARSWIVSETKAPEVKIEVLESPEYVLALRINARITQSDVQHAIDAARERLSKYDKISLYVEIEKFSGSTLDAMLKDLSFGISNMMSFYRTAIITAPSWFDKLSKIGQDLLPNSSFKHYNSDEKDVALAWVSEAYNAPAATIKTIDLADHVIGFSIHHKLNKADIAQISTQVEDKLQRHEALAVYVELHEFEAPGLTFDALIEDIQLGFKHFKSFKKKAVVSKHEWMEKLIQMGGPLFKSLEAKHFLIEDSEAAKAWVLDSAQEPA